MAKQTKFALEIDRDGILKFAKENFGKLKWNGRQIRNAIQTAMVLAEYDAYIDQSHSTPDQKLQDLGSRERRKVRLTIDEFDKVAKASSGFDEYLRSVRGYDDSQEAKNHLLRNDYFRFVNEPNHPQPALQPPEEIEYSEDETLNDPVKLEEERKRIDRQKRLKMKFKKEKEEQAKQDALKRQLAEIESKTRVKEEKKRRKLEEKRAKDSNASSNVSSDEDEME